MLAHFRETLVPIYGESEARAMTNVVFRERKNWDLLQLEMNAAEAIGPAETLELDRVLERLVKGEPIQYVLGTVRFMGLDLTIGSGVLIPRPETEELVHTIIQIGLEPASILDIGTGSGCIALAMKNTFPRSTVFAVDVSKDALAIAELNKKSTGLEIELIHANVLTETDRLPRKLDLIVSNPPYIPVRERDTLEKQVRDHEPELALFVQDADPLLFYRAIGKYALEVLNAQGELWFEGHYVHTPSVGTLLNKMGFLSVTVMNDLSGSVRFVRARKV